jgi:hypothetical protein
LCRRLEEKKGSNEQAHRHCCLDHAWHSKHGGVASECFTAYDCMDRSNVIEPNLLLEPHVFAASVGNEEKSFR